MLIIYIPLIEDSYGQQEGDTTTNKLKTIKILLPHYLKEKKLLHVIAGDGFTFVIASDNESLWLGKQSNKTSCK